MRRGKKAEKVVRGLLVCLLIIGIVVSRQYVMGTEVVYIAEEPAVQAVEGLVGLGDVVFQIETPSAPENITEEEAAPTPAPETDHDIERLRDFEYLRRQFFVSDRNTRLLPSDIDADEFLRADLRIRRDADGPQVLIFHTHSTEMFADSDPSNPLDGVLGLGAYLAEILEREHGIKTLHDTTRYDIVDGRTQIMGAYERMEPYILQILRDNPSIEIVIDLHRDGFPEGTPPPVTYINGERAARIMFVNGLSRRYNNSGVLEPVEWLPNPYLRDNLTFSFQLQMAANRMYPGFARRIYLKAFRYSLHMLPRSILLEIGAQNNTMEEARNAVPHLAAVIAEVIL